MEPGSKEKSIAIEDLAKLYKLRIEETRNEWDFNEKYESRDSDIQFKKGPVRRTSQRSIFQTGSGSSSIILPLIFYAAWMKRGLDSRKLELIPLRHFEVCLIVLNQLRNKGLNSSRSGESCELHVLFVFPTSVRTGIPYR